MKVKFSPNTFGAMPSDMQSSLEFAIKTTAKLYNMHKYEIVTVNSGQTKSLKKILKDTRNQFFIKVGEKIDKEIVAYRSRFIENNPLFVQPILSDELQGRALVLPFVKGAGLEDFIFDSHLDWDKKFSFLNKLLRDIETGFWSKNVQKGQKFLSQTIKEYITKRFECNKDTTFITDKEKVYFSKIIELPIIYKTRGRPAMSLPCISEMIDRVAQHFNTFPAVFTSCIMGDFQPSNIIIKLNHDIKIVDLSNFEESGDVAMDLGKFFNYFSRFFMVSLARDGKASFEKAAQVKLQSDSLEISLEKPDNPVFNNLAVIMEENFANEFAVKTRDYFMPDRIKLYKFITNVITLRRHFHQENVIDLLFACIVDSFVEIQERAIKI